MISIGGGAGGLVSAIGAVKLGGKAAIIERNVMGGDCLNTGWVPSKAMLKAAKIAQIWRNAQEFGIEVGEVKVNFAKVMERIRQVRAKISYNDSVYKFKKKYDIDVFLGQAEFLSKDELKINDRVFNFNTDLGKVCIATGCSPFIPDIENIELFPYFTNENIFNISDQPKHLVVVGTGPIGWELGQSFARLGTKVTMLDQVSNILPREDPAASDLLKNQMIKDGVEFLMNSTPIGCKVINSESKIWNPECKIDLKIKTNGKIHSLQADSILFAVGRRPNIDGLGLDKAGIEYDTKLGIKINDLGQTSNKKVYAVGDICSKFHFTHAADHMARNMANNAFSNGSAKYSDLKMSWCTYTDPEIAHVGMTLNDMDSVGTKYNTYELNFEHNDRAICDSTKGFVKIHTKHDSDEILGCTIAGGPAGDMISHVANAMENKVGLKWLGTGVHPYPTYSEAFKALTSQYTSKFPSSGTFKFAKAILSKLR